MAKLIFTNKEHAPTVYELTLEKTTVGRAPGNTLVITDGSLSAHHCEIHVNGPEVIVRDLGSRNGTFVNGAKLVNQQAQMKSGQTVRFGSVEARLELGDPPSDETVSEMTAVHAMGRIMRDQRRERERPKPADPSMKLPSSDSSESEDHTVTTLATRQGKESAASARPESAEIQPRKSSNKAVIVIAAILALGLIVFLWLWWGRK